MSISIEKRQSYSEVLEFVYLLDKEYISKIPKKLLNYFEANKDKSYTKNINPWEPIENQNLKKDTITLISLLNLKYWASEEEKEKLMNAYNENELKFQEDSRKKYNPDNIFKYTESVPIKSNNLPTEIKEEKQSFIFKIINIIKSLFK